MLDQGVNTQDRMTRRRSGEARDAGSDGQATAELKIVGAVIIGDNHSAQLVTVQILRTSPPYALSTDTNLLAKIYDPLYFDHEQDYVDPFLCVDRDYAVETAAYLALPQNIPNYFGSYTLQWPIDGTTTRLVRLILIELVSGKARKIKIIDFKKAGLKRTLYSEEEQRYLPGVSISPLLRWNNAWGFWHVFEACVDWDWQSWLEDTRASITDHMKRAQVDKGPKRLGSGGYVSGGAATREGVGHGEATIISYAKQRMLAANLSKFLYCCILDGLYSVHARLLVLTFGVKECDLGHGDI
ncbi:hypothetical protein AJ78_00541 [Emergomyces pasteurianus Ep9510]|uniref:Uncharacterized protein n=1 Tax=Emergomyces pasteurianus Ep9510 TaxID=1447872 RepID=A0A1J9PSS3_9EURO|nr:hypothetical protein AJ78_00541 [Emergomyces pasteurianus Ep9510]